MPHKTHKTAHVLNLLSVGTGKEETTEQAVQTEQIEPKETGANIQLIGNPIDPSDPLAGLIKDSLEKEIFGDIGYEDTSNPEDTSGEEELQYGPDDIHEADTQPAPDLQSSQSSEQDMKDAQKAQAVSTQQPESEEKTPVSSAQAQNQAPAQSQVPVTNQTPPELPIQPPAIPEPDYCYVNIMDVLIDRRLEEFMNKFDTCTCDRCKKDVRALAMSNLPPKYIVMPNTSYAPLISFYANKYQFNIVTELTKACLAIISNPRHE